MEQFLENQEFFELFEKKIEIKKNSLNFSKNQNTFEISKKSLRHWDIFPKNNENIFELSKKHILKIFQKIKNFRNFQKSKISSKIKNFFEFSEVWKFSKKKKFLWNFPKKLFFEFLKNENIFEIFQKTKFHCIFRKICVIFLKKIFGKFSKKQIFLWIFPKKQFFRLFQKKYLWNFSKNKISFEFSEKNCETFRNKINNFFEFSSFSEKPKKLWNFQEFL